MKPLAATVSKIIVVVVMLTLSVGPLGCSDCDLTISTGTLPDAAVGVPYSFRVNSDCGGDFWFISDGILPPGIGLSDTGVLSGTPTHAGTFPFTLGVIDDDSGDRAYKGFAMLVAPGS